MCCNRRTDYCCQQDEEKEDENDADDDSPNAPAAAAAGTADGTLPLDDGEGKETTDKELEEEFAAWQACIYYAGNGAVLRFFSLATGRG